TIGTYTLVKRLHRPVLLFDALGLSLFTVTGAQKAMAYGCNSEVAILLGITTAVGGGVLRDVLLNRVPLILEKEIYASAALAGALFVVAGKYFQWTGSWVSFAAFLLCFGLRLLSVRYHWNLPVFQEGKAK
ncbi:MAG: TRIC cation channel family protein, partial [Bacteroidales bacterium]|nr:TRIC cation channel family protein [Bacteroidales bacterium]